MKKLLKPASILFCLLMFLSFFMLGIMVAGWLEVAKGQMLAGGAIVLMWGIIFAVVAFIVGVILARYVPHKWVVRLNWLLLLLIGISYGINHYKYLQRKKANAETEQTPR